MFYSSFPPLLSSLPPSPLFLHQVCSYGQGMSEELHQGCTDPDVPICMIRGLAQCVRFGETPRALSYRLILTLSPFPSLSPSSPLLSLLLSPPLSLLPPISPSSPLLSLPLSLLLSPLSLSHYRHEPIRYQDFDQAVWRSRCRNKRTSKLRPLSPPPSCMSSTCS